MGLQHNKVLVFWLPDEDLRLTREMEIGLKWGTDVQVVGVDAAPGSRTPEVAALQYATARACTQGTSANESHRLLVGFRGEPQYSGKGWTHQGTLFPQPPKIPLLREDLPPHAFTDRNGVIRWTQEPSVDNLLQVARKQSSEDPEIIDHRIEVIRKAVERVHTRMLEAQEDRGDLIGLRGQAHASLQQLYGFGIEVLDAGPHVTDRNEWPDAPTEPGVYWYLHPQAEKATIRRWGHGQPSSPGKWLLVQHEE